MKPHTISFHVIREFTGPLSTQVFNVLIDNRYCGELEMTQEEWNTFNEVVETGALNVDVDAE